MTTYAINAGSPELDEGPDEALIGTLWIAQVLLALAFCGAGFFKLTAPIADLAAAMHWPGDYPVWFVRSIAIVDLAGGLGILLPTLTRILPRLTVLAALGCSVLQALAMAFHVSRGEYYMLTTNSVLLGMALYVLWGRGFKVPVTGLERDAAWRRFFTITIWAAQVALAAAFCGAGLFKLTAPIPDLAAAMHWPGEYPLWFVRSIAIVDLAGGIGILLPAATRVLPRLTLLAAIGCIALQALAMGFHSMRGEFYMLPANAVLLALAVYVLWCRAFKERIIGLEGEAAWQRFYKVSLWIAQAGAGVFFIFTGMFKISAPIADLATAMRWPGEYPAWFVRTMGMVDMAGGLGLLLPALTRILPRLTILAALGCVVLQTLATGFHTTRGEFGVLPLNVALLAASIYVLWGRSRKAPVTARA